MPDNWWQDKWSKMTIWLAFSCGRKTSATSQPKTSPFKLVWNRLEPLFLITPSLRSWWVFPWAEEDQTQTHLEPSRPKHNLWTWRCPRSEYWPSFVLEIPGIFLFLLSLLLFLSWLDMAVFSTQLISLSVTVNGRFTHLQITLSANNNTSSFRVGSDFFPNEIQEPLIFSLRFWLVFLLHEGLVLRILFIGLGC